MMELVVAGLSLDPVNKAPILVLCTKNNSHILPIWIGSSEAISISFALRGEISPRPLTHDLLLSTIKELGFSLSSVDIVNVEDGVFYANLLVTNGNSTHKIDCRPSDAVGLAIRMGAPIFTNDYVMETAGYEFPDDLDSPAVPVIAGDGVIEVIERNHDMPGIGEKEESPGKGSSTMSDFSNNPDDAPQNINSTSPKKTNSPELLDKNGKVIITSLTGKDPEDGPDGKGGENDKDDKSGSSILLDMDPESKYKM